MVLPNDKLYYSTSNFKLYHYNLSHNCIFLNIVADLSHNTYIRKISVATFVKFLHFTKTSDDVAMTIVRVYRWKRYAVRNFRYTVFCQFLILSGRFGGASKTRSIEHGIVLENGKPLPLCCRGLGKQGCALLVHKSSCRTNTSRVSRFVMS